ncbi:hypothetical protein MNBD_GAMMA10-644 [hydrothermal vent metagenome]|uniref:Uncharacterized protein n=1 Tax=hydrothermal vent metagenome TaxID=652676 RepID=A0A3B0YNH5_9ZZZZ
MNKLIYKLAVLLMLSGFSAYSSAKTVKEIDSYGIYVAADNGYVKVTPYKQHDKFANFNDLNKIPYVKRKSDQVKFVVYTSGFHSDNYRFEIRPIQTTIKMDEVSFSAKPMSKKDMYEITLDESVANGNMLHIMAPEISGYNMGIVMLGNTEDELVKYFSNKKLDAAYAVKKYLEDSLEAYPENKKLKELMVYWTKAASDEKDKRSYKYVDEAWDEYNSATKIHVKLSRLKTVVSEINGYLRDFPKGSMASEATQRKKTALEKIEEYEVLL